MPKEVLNINHYSEYDTIIALIRETFKSGGKIRITAINPEKVTYALKNKKFAQIISQSQINIPDGIGIVFASILQGNLIKSRVTGVDLMHKICAELGDIKPKVFLFGAKPGVVEKAKDVLAQKYPGIQIVGHEHGYIEDKEKLIKKVNSSGAEILFVALGSPKQELWIAENIDKLNVRMLMGVGGAFDVTAGLVARAPVFLRKIGLEWFYRMTMQPQRIWRLKNLVYFALNITKFRLSNSQFEQKPNFEQETSFLRRG